MFNFFEKHPFIALMMVASICDAAVNITKAIFEKPVKAILLTRKEKRGNVLEETKETAEEKKNEPVEYTKEN